MSQSGRSDDNQPERPQIVTIYLAEFLSNVDKVGCSDHIIDPAVFNHDTRRFHLPIVQQDTATQESCLSRHFSSFAIRGQTLTRWLQFYLYTKCN